DSRAAFFCTIHDHAFYSHPIERLRKRMRMPIALQSFEHSLGEFDNLFPHRSHFVIDHETLSEGRKITHHFQCARQSSVTEEVLLLECTIPRDCSKIFDAIQKTSAVPRIPFAL